MTGRIEAWSSRVLDLGLQSGRGQSSAGQCWVVCITLTLEPHDQRWHFAATTPELSNPTSRGMLGGAGLGILGLAAIVLCCAGPLLVAAILTGGLEVWLVSKGALLAAVAVVLVAAVAGTMAVRRRP